ncbi:hypothetical protein DSO57_1028060 [Entomophthora muscae]|uniref:Uncharacterized protein n=1 Tax=Entomophthora muscae TaxID=34485 RepID=A0ACC2UNL0_9FUNG|nr:hypothetical protein DSO57_1028060 [Entomophthora muscae]
MAKRVERSNTGTPQESKRVKIQDLKFIPFIPSPALFATPPRPVPAFREMAPSPEELPPSELTNAEALQLVTFIKDHTKANDPDYLLAREIEKQIRDGQLNWEESQTLKKIY